MAVVILTRKVNVGLGAAASYLLISAGIALILAGIVGDRLAERLKSATAAR